MYSIRPLTIATFCFSALHVVAADFNNSGSDSTVIMATDSVVATTDTAAGTPLAAAAGTAASVEKAPIHRCASAPVPQQPCFHRHRKNLIVVRETNDTVFVFNKLSIYNAVQNWRRNFDVLRQRSIGLSGSSTYGVYAVSVDPLEELVEKDYYLSNKHFDFGHFDHVPFPMSGGMGCIGLGDGFRLGGCGMVGERNFSSDNFNGDSIIVLGVQVSYGGFMVEKAMVKNRWNFVAGGTIGGGAIKVVESVKDRSSWFTAMENQNDFQDFDATFKNGNSTQAGFFLLEPHCGVSYTFFHFFHIGLNVSLPTFLSVEKFNIYTNDFISVNPGLYLKLIFGNLG